MRDAYIQIDASESNIEFDHRGLDQRRYQEHNRAVYRQKLAEQGTPLPDGPRGLFVPRRIFGVPVPEHAFNQWQEAVNFPEKQSDVKAIFMRGLQMPSSPAPLDRWVKPSFTENKIRFYRWNPDYVRKQDAKAAQAQKPADGSPGQAAGQPKQEQPEKQAQQQRQTAPTNIPCVSVEIFEAGIRLSSCVLIEVDLSLWFIVMLCRFCNTFPKRSESVLAVSPTT